MWPREAILMKLENRLELVKEMEGKYNLGKGNPPQSEQGPGNREMWKQVT